jgi:hypothetical protein
MEETLLGLLAPAASNRYWGRAPQGIKAPYLVLYRISGTPQYTMQGPSGYVASRVQIDCFAASYGAAKALARAVKVALSGYRGGAFMGVFVVADRDMSLSGLSDATKVQNDPAEDYRASIDVMIHHTE